jgi:hypothetical protein
VYSVRLALVFHVLVEEGYPELLMWLDDDAPADASSLAVRTRPWWKEYVGAAPTPSIRKSFIDTFAIAGFNVSWERHR